MTADHDLDQQLDAFLREGPTELPYQSFDAVRDRTEETSQRVVIGPWRTPTMNRMLTFGLGGTAVVAVLLLGAQLIGSLGGIGSGADPTPTPQPTGSARPSTTAYGTLPQGSHLLWDGETAGAQIIVTIPGPGWNGERRGGILVKNDNVNAPDGAGLIVFAEPTKLFGSQPLYVYGDPCHWSTTRPDTPVTTVDDAVAALSSQPSRNASTPEDVTVGGHAGKTITLHVPDDADFSTCDQGEYRTLAQGPDGAREHQDPGQIDELWVLDVAGDLVIIDAAYYDQTPLDVVNELRDMVHSATIAPAHD